VLRLLEAGIIYPIVDSRWVSPVHCVPKKGGMTVVPNDNDELIPQRRYSWMIFLSMNSFDNCLRTSIKFCRDVKKLTLFLIGRNATLWLMKELYWDIKFPREVLKLIELKLKQLRRCPILGMLKIGRVLIILLLIICLDWKILLMILFLNDSFPNEQLAAIKILSKCHGSAYGGHHAGERTAQKVLQSGFYWPTLFKDARKFILSCDECQRVGNISRRNEMPMNYTLVIEPFDCWGFDFMGPFPSSEGNTHILVAVDYVTKWVEAIPTKSVDGETSLRMLLDIIFPRFGVPRYIITDGGSHFIHGGFRKTLARYGINHRIASAYHPQTSGQVELSNREIKSILQKTVNKTRKNWAKLEHKAYWAVRELNKDPKLA
ncbi:hypothetical protein QYE76_018498, partial [Lolium multiflorum]